MSGDQFFTHRRATDGPRRASLPAPDREGVASRHHPRAPRRRGSRARWRSTCGPAGRCASRLRGRRAATGTVEAVDAPRLLAFTWGTDRLTFELAPDGDGTTFTLTHSFDDRYGAASFATGWELCLAGLRSVLAGEPLPPPDRGIARHEELVHEFGLDQPEVTESGGRWTVRSSAS